MITDRNIIKQKLVTAKKIKGNWATILLPINADNSIDCVRLSEQIDYLTAAGLDGIYSNGTAGELHNLCEEEFDKIQFLLSEKCQKAGVCFQIGISHPVPLICLKRIERLKKLKPFAFQVIFPQWIPMQPQEQVDFLREIAFASGEIPIVLYHPPHANPLLTPTDFKYLIDSIPQLIGIKVGCGDQAWYDQMRIHSKRISIFIPGHFLATGIKQKVAAGSYSNIACLSPKGSQEWWSLMQSDLQQALSVQSRILNFFDECIVPFQRLRYCDPALDKFLAAVGGWSNIGTRLRWPYRWIDEEHVVRVRKKAVKVLPEFLIT